MNYCKKCGKQIDDGAAFVPTVLHRKTRPSISHMMRHTEQTALPLQALFFPFSADSWV